jgi:hypothetical protein
MREIQQLSESEIDWSRLAPVLDRVMSAGGQNQPGMGE